MGPICWLHISDIHLTRREVWSQDVVLRAMCEQIESQRANGVVPDFVLMTGDIASTGKDEEYALASDFFDALSAASDVPGDHDCTRSCRCGTVTRGTAAAGGLMHPYRPSQA